MEGFMDDESKQSWCFISETSFSTRSDVPVDILEYAAVHDAPNGDAHGPDGAKPLVADMHRFREPNFSKESNATTMTSSVRWSEHVGSSLHLSALATSSQRVALAMSIHRSARDPPSAYTKVTFSELHESIPIECHASSFSSPPIMVLEESPNPKTPCERSSTAQSYLNHALYGALRDGELGDPFSSEYLGLAVTAAVTGFMTTFLSACLLPMLAPYTNLSDHQRDTAQRLIALPGALSFGIGVASDFFPLCNLHRKSYMLLGWIFAFTNVLALGVAVTVDGTELETNAAQTFDGGGGVYIALIAGANLGITMAAVTALALLVELSQREPTHDRGSVMIKYLFTKEAGKLVAVITAHLVMNYLETKDIFSLKIVVLIMVLVASVPLPAVLFCLNEDAREIKVNAAVDRSSRTRQFWNALQQQAVWRILLFICATVLLVFFQFEQATQALLVVAQVSPNAQHLGEIPTQALVVGVLWVYRVKLLNYKWTRVSITSVLITVVATFTAAMPFHFEFTRSPWFVLTVQSLTGISRGLVIVLTTLPLIEIADSGMEGATTGLVSSFDVLIRSAVATVSRTISTPSGMALALTLGQCGIHLVALLPSLYLLPPQKFHVQQMRAYGGNNRTAGAAIVVLVFALVVYTSTVEVLAVTHTF